MIGHIKPKACKLPSGAKDEYMNLYCSICYSLRRQFGVLGSLLISSELTIILIALRDYFTPEHKWYRCPAKIHFTRKPVSIHETVDCAARFSFLFGWLKVLDWETDKPSLCKKGVRKLLDKKADSILTTLGEESRHVIEEYCDLIKSNCRDFPNIRRMSYSLARTVCIELGRQTEIGSDDLTPLSELLGIASGESKGLIHNLFRKPLHVGLSVAFGSYEDKGMKFPSRNMIRSATYQDLLKTEKQGSRKPRRTRKSRSESERRKLRGCCDEESTCCCLGEGCCCCSEMCEGGCDCCDCGDCDCDC